MLNKELIQQLYQAITYDINKFMINTEKLVPLLSYLSSSITKILLQVLPEI